jgi:outer membrane immunogenic protein
MRRILIAGVCALAAGQALAADLPPAAPPPRAPAVYVPPAPPPFSWTAFYIGGNVGAGWNTATISDSLTNSSWGVNNNTTFIGGGQVGGNLQFNALVVGVEADFDWFANSNNSGNGVQVDSTFLQGSNNGRWVTTVTGRLGVAIDRLLLYAKGGGAWVGSNNLTLTNVSGTGNYAFTNNNTNTGWTAGAGVEWAFVDNVSARLEYDYVGLSDQTYTIPSTFPTGPNGTVFAGDTFSSTSRNIQMLTLGINVLFH